MLKTSIMSIGEVTEPTDHADFAQTFHAALSTWSWSKAVEHVIPYSLQNNLCLKSADDNTGF